MNLTKSFLDKFNMFIGVLVLCATVFGVWYQTSEKHLVLDLDLLNIDELTELSNTPNLKANFKYNETEVSHLWKATFRMKNVGDKVIIGKGSHSNLLEKSIPITFGEHFKIIDQEVSYNDINLNAKVDSNQINVTFEQWREDELAVISVYLEALDSDNKKPFPIVISRSLVNGVIKINDISSVKGVQEKEPKIVFPESILKSGKFIFGLFIFICAILIVIALFKAPIEFYKRKVWEKNNLEEFNKYLNELDSNTINEKLSSHLIEKCKSDPEVTPQIIWSNFKGEKLTSSSISSTYKGLIIFTTFSLVISLSFIITIFGT